MLCSSSGRLYCACSLIWYVFRAFMQAFYQIEGYIKSANSSLSKFLRTNQKKTVQPWSARWQNALWLWTWKVAFRGRFEGMYLTITDCERPPDAVWILGKALRGSDWKPPGFFATTVLCSDMLFPEWRLWAVATRLTGNVQPLFYPQECYCSCFLVQVSYCNQTSWCSIDVTRRLGGRWPQLLCIRQISSW
jgi:hypothetical protein